MKCHEFCHGEKEKKSCDFHFSLVIITKKLHMKGKTKEYENTYLFFLQVQNVLEILGK